MELNRVTLLAAVLTACCLTVTGCSSSEGYVDYSSIPGPPPPEQQADESDSATGDQAGSAATATGDPEVPRTAQANSEETSPTETPAAATTAVQQQDNLPAAAAGDSTDEPLKAHSPENDTPTVAGSLAGVGTSEVVFGPDGERIMPTAALAEERPAEPREIELLVPDKTFREEKPGLIRVSYDDIDLLKVLNMEPVPTDAQDHFPKWLNELDGRRIRLRGFMFPTFVAEGIKRFGFARDNGICCFVKQPKVYDMIEVSMADGETTEYIDGRPFDVEGTFRIDPEADGTELFQLYRIENAIVLD